MFSGGRTNSGYEIEARYFIGFLRAAYAGKVSIGRVRYLLSIMFYTFRCSIHLFSVVAKRACLVAGKLAYIDEL